MTCAVANHLITMATFTKGPCSLGEKCVAPHADLRPIYKCKNCEAQLHSVVYHCGIPASEGGFQMHRVTPSFAMDVPSWLNVHQTIVLLRRVRLLLLFFIACMMTAKSLCMPPVPSLIWKKWNRIFARKMGQFFIFVVQDMSLLISRQDNPLTNRKINHFVRHGQEILVFKYRLIGGQPKGIGMPTAAEKVRMAVQRFLIAVSWHS